MRNRWSQLEHGESGFNLIEVTLAVVVVAVGLLAVLGLLPIGVDASRRVSDDTVITTIIGDLLHWRRVTPFDKETWFPGGDNRLSPPRPKTITTILDQNGEQTGDPLFDRPYFRVTYEVKDHPRFGSAAPDIAQVIITVEWPLINTTTLAPNFERRVYVSNFSAKQ